MRLTSRLLLYPMLLLGMASRWFSHRRTTPLRILVAHHLLLGDTLMLAPLLAKLRQQYPQAQIFMTCRKAFTELFALQPYGVEALPYDPADVSSLYALWKNRGFDLALLPADNRLSWLARALGSRHTIAFSGDHPAYKNWFVDEFRHFPSTPTALPEIFPLLVEGPAAPAFVPENWPMLPGKSFDLPPAPYAVLHLGASNSLREWSATRWQELAQWLSNEGITPVWSAGNNEIALVKKSDPKARFPSYAGQLDLLQLAHLLRNARLLVCPDTGVAHMGRVVNTPTVTIFGQGSAQLFGAGEFWKNSPYKALSVEIECRNQTNLFKRQVVWVRRCARKKGDQENQCPEALCMEKIGLETVITACQNLIQQHGT